MLMPFYTTISLPNIRPDGLYKITAPAGVKVYYSGKLVFGTGAIGYFVANDTTDAVIETGQIVTVSQDITLTEFTRSYYDAYDGSGGTWSFQRNIDRWTSRYSYRPEWMSMVGGRLVTFKNGKPYIHIAPTEYVYYTAISNSPANSFYGQTTDDSVLAFVHNEASAQTNVYTGLAMNNSGVYCGVHIRTEPNHPQSSSLVHNTYDPYEDFPQNRDGDFRLREDMVYASIKRDRLSPNATGTANEKEVKGDPMRGNYSLFQFTWSQLAAMIRVLRTVDIGFIASRGHKTIQ
jgi:hypothetical protein